MQDMNQDIKNERPVTGFPILYINRFSDNGKGFQRGHIELCDDLVFDTLETEPNNEGGYTLLLNTYRCANLTPRSVDSNDPRALRDDRVYDIYYEGALWAAFVIGDDAPLRSHNGQIQSVEATDRDSVLYQTVNLLSHYIPASTLRTWLNEQIAKGAKRYKHISYGYPKVTEQAEAADSKNEKLSKSIGTATLNVTIDPSKFGDDVVEKFREAKADAERVSGMVGKTLADMEEWTSKVKEEKLAKMPALVNTQVILRSHPRENPAIVCSLVVGDDPDDGAVRIEHWYYDDEGNPMVDDPNHGDSIDVPFKLVHELCRVLGDFESAAFVMALNGYTGNE